VAQCADLAELGATVEFSAHSCMGRPAVFRDVLGALGTLDPRRVVLSTDYGWTTGSPRPAPGFRGYLDALWHAGLDEPLLARFARHNPARLLGLAG
jgi:hypothetical protein